MHQISIHAPVEVKLILVGNKSDLDKERRVSYEEGLQVAGKYGVPFFECSAKTGLNVHEMFNKMGADILERLQKGHKDSFDTQENGPNLKKGAVTRYGKKCCE